MGVDKTGVDEMRTYRCEILCYHYHVSTANMSEGIEQNKKSFMVPMYFTGSKLALYFSFCQHGFTALTCAVGYGRMDVVRLLICGEASINIQEKVCLH